MKFCTVVARNYLAYARVLAQSLHDVYGDADISVLVLDDEDGFVDEAREPFKVLRPADLDIEPREFHHMAVIYDILELATAVKPWLLQHLLESDDVACYLDPDIEVFSSLDEIERLALRHSIVLTPHTTTPMPRDGLIPSEQTIRLAGVFNLGFVAVSRDAAPFLAWWSERLRRECRVAVAQGLFVDQRWIDFVPAYFEHTVLLDEGYNVAYWNLYDRAVKLGADGYEVNGRPLRFYHYSGFDPLRPQLLSKHQVGVPRIKLQDQFAVAYLCGRYAARIMAADHLEALAQTYRYNYTALGVTIDHRVRMLYRNELEAAEEQGRDPRIPDPFDVTEAGAFLTWLAGPGPAGSDKRISRYIRQMCDERPDVANQFVDLAGFGGVQLLEWIRRHGRENAGVLPECVPAPVAGPRPRPEELPTGVNLVGYLRAEDGLGSVARSVLDVLRLAGSPVSMRTCTTTPSRQRTDIDDSGDHSEITYDTTIACVNADQFPLLLADMGDRLPVAASTVGIWAWEVEGFPEWMARSAALVDEVWVYSRHAADAIAPMVDVPVHVFAPPIDVPERLPAVDRDTVGFTDDFTFLFCFDFRSGFERKNPMAVIESFQRAFVPGEGPRLVIKSVNRAVAPVAWARMQAAVGDRTDIELRDGYEPAEIQRRLMAACDCYVSLHRAEGYGLTMAEAMALGRPVIGTGYSGNLEFMTPETSVLVPYEMERIPFGCGPYPPTASWAAADAAVAAHAMRRLASDPGEAARLGAAARSHVIRCHTAASRLELIRERLHDLRSSR